MVSAASDQSVTIIDGVSETGSICARCAKANCVLRQQFPNKASCFKENRSSPSLCSSGNKRLPACRVSTGSCFSLNFKMKAPRCLQRHSTTCASSTRRYSHRKESGRAQKFSRPRHRSRSRPESTLGTSKHSAACASRGYADDWWLNTSLPWDLAQSPGDKS
jgi:hypothetical protein